ncbi:hypothetical protein V9T40_000168 [Parthenolecanium corni]|uniref:Uncharacterized protein n=1 Tax=Parthenolecanium corni TaxID=536013 RepID=A0AAN9TS63_9HEMI
MELSKRSCLTSAKTFDQTLPRGHTSEITDVKRRGGHRMAERPRRTFTFKGSLAKRATNSPATSKQRAGAHSPAASSRDASLMRTAGVSDSVRSRRVRSTSKIRTPATQRSRSRSTQRHTASQKPSPKPPSRAASAAGSQPASRKASSVAAEPNLPSLSMPPPSALAPVSTAAAVDSELREMIGQPLSPPEFIKVEESKLVSSPPPKSSDSEEEEEDDGLEADDEQPEPNVTIEVPRSPSIVGYRKVMYDEQDHKWIAHWKMEEDAKRAKERRKLEALKAKTVAKQQQLPKPHKVKGRSTAQMQVMFPTAIIKEDRRHGFVHNINMTDPLRLELHKRKAPIVPTFYQKHILQFGKLPFRNNPRPHPVV